MYNFVTKSKFRKNITPFCNIIGKLKAAKINSNTNNSYFIIFNIAFKKFFLLIHIAKQFCCLNINELQDKIIIIKRYLTNICVNLEEYKSWKSAEMP